MSECEPSHVFYTTLNASERLNTVLLSHADLHKNAFLKNNSSVNIFVGGTGIEAQG